MSEGRILLVLAVYLVVGVPIVGFLWNAVNEVARGDLGQLLVVVPLALVFGGFLVVLGRGLRRMERRG